MIERTTVDDFGAKISGLGLNVSYENQSNLKTGKEQNTIRVSFFEFGIKAGLGLVGEVSKNYRVKVEY